jgi:hypothetical protein
VIIKARVIVEAQVDCSLFKEEKDAEDWLRDLIQTQLPAQEFAVLDPKQAQYPLTLTVGRVFIKAAKPEPKK